MLLLRGLAESGDILLYYPSARPTPGRNLSSPCGVDSDETPNRRAASIPEAAYAYAYAEASCSQYEDAHAYAYGYAYGVLLIAIRFG